MTRRGCKHCKKDWIDHYGDDYRCKDGMNIYEKEPVKQVTRGNR